MLSSTFKGNGQSKQPKPKLLLFSSISVQVDIGFLIDGSSRVTLINFKYFLEYVKIIVHAFPVSKEGIHIGLAVVSSNGKNVIFGFNKYTDSLSMDPAIDATVYPGSEAVVGESISKVKDELFVTSSRTGAIKILVVILGGKSSDDVTIPSQDLKTAGVNRVIVVAITSNTDKTVYTPPATVPNDVILSVTYITIKTTAQILVTRINSGKYLSKWTCEICKNELCEKCELSGMLLRPF